MSVEDIEGNATLMKMTIRVEKCGIDDVGDSLEDTPSEAVTLLDSDME